MSYSITTIIQPYADKQGNQKVLLQVIHNRMKVYVPTLAKVPADNFLKGTIIKHKHKKTLNDAINEQRNEIEAKLLEAIRAGRIKTKADLTEAIKGRANRHLIFEFIIDLTVKLKGKISDGRLKHYKVIANKIDDYSPNTTFGNVSLQWLIGFETWLRKTGIDGNTVLSNMSLVIAILNKAHADSLVDPKQYKLYKRDKYNQKLVEYLTEEELLKIKAAIDLSDRPSYKRAGYYFLLSSFTGFRFSDSSRFDYDEMVKDGAVVLQATKNSKIISIPLYPQLREVLEFVKDNPLDLSNDKTRQYVQEICKFVGIKKKVKYHTSRHNFAMFLLSKGISIDEVAALLGDTKLVAKVYARISNEHIKGRFKEKLG
jgi:integrase/recombinase XerD